MSAIDEDISPKVLGVLLDNVYKYTGIKMDEKKRTMLKGRIRSRINDLGLSNYEEYTNHLTQHTEEVEKFVNAVTTNETTFYRTPRVWDYFSKIFLPDWFQKNSGKTLKLWSAAASSGEEAYTMSIFCNEFKIQNPSFQFQIMATDISTEVLKKAQQAHYSARSVDNLKKKMPLLFAKYIMQINDVYTVSDGIKTPVKFAQQNLFKTFNPADKFDIVFLRNVLIYFDGPDQEKVLANIKKAICQAGMLILGESESLNGLNTSFKFVEPLIYQEAGGQ